MTDPYDELEKAENITRPPKPLAVTKPPFTKPPFTKPPLNINDRIRIPEKRVSQKQIVNIQNAKLTFDQHMDILLHCIIYAKTQSYDNAIGVSRMHELEDSLQCNLPLPYNALIHHSGNLTNYFLQVQKRGSSIYDKFFQLAKEGFQVMSELDYYNDPRGFERLNYNFQDSYNSYVFIVLPYNKNHVLQDIKKEIKTQYKPLPSQKRKKRDDLRERRRPRQHDVTEQDLALEKEIMELYRDNQVKEEELEKRLDLKQRIHDMVNEVWPNQGLKVVIFGSSANGLGADEGDLDLCITAPGKPPTKKERIYRMDMEDIYDMDYLAGHLKRIGMLAVYPINKAHVPICRFRDPKTGLKADINANSRLGIENTRMIRQYTYLDKRVGPFLFAIKYFANKKKINDSPNGTISSYAYYLLGLHYLMAVLKYPIIPSLQHLGTDCEDPIHCSYRNTGRIESYDVRYHTCVKVISKTPYEMRNPDGRFDAYTIWHGYNGDNLGYLIRDFFRWMSDITVLTQPKSIIKDDGFPYNVDENIWWDDTLCIQDPFIQLKNIAHPCNELGLQSILHDFQVACDKLDLEHATFSQICNPDEMVVDPKPITEN